MTAVLVPRARLVSALDRSLRLLSLGEVANLAHDDVSLIDANQHPGRCGARRPGFPCTFDMSCNPEPSEISDRPGRFPRAFWQAVLLGPGLRHRLRGETERR